MRLENLFINETSEIRITCLEVGLFFRPIKRLNQKVGSKRFWSRGFDQEVSIKRFRSRYGSSSRGWFEMLDQGVNQYVGPRYWVRILAEKAYWARQSTLTSLICTKQMFSKITQTQWLAKKQELKYFKKC